MAINKDLTANPLVNFQLAHFTASGPVQVWRLTSANAIARVSDLAVSNASFSTSLPAQSITLFVLPPSATPPQAPKNLRVLR